MKYIAKSLPKKGKIKNGDHFSFYEDERIQLACVADGVGGNACDWKASEQACEDLAYFYKNEFADLGVREGIAQSLRKTYAKIYWTKGPCEGMLTTLVSVAIDRQAGEYFYFGIGDSLILKFEEGKIEELTPECGFRIQPDLLPSRVKSGGPLREGTCFALMSDGISTNRKNYRQEIALVLGSEDWERKFEEIMALNQVTQFDDMTLLLLKG